MAFSGPDLGDDGDEARPLAEINVTPLVDVMLVLLIVFMVAAPMMVVGVPVNLPSTAAPRAASPTPPVVLTVARDGRVWLAAEEVPEGALPERLRTARGENPDTPVYVRGDRAAAYGEVLRVMGQVTRAGVSRVSLIAEAEGAAPAVRAR